jgi:hypothetical protein
MRTDLLTVWSNLVGRPGGPDLEPPVINWLRDYSYYLTPKLRLLSIDVWTDVAIILRNIILNWLLVVPAICVLILLVKLLVVAFSWAVEGTWYATYTLYNLAPRSRPDFDLFLTNAALLVGGFFSLVFAVAFTVSDRPSLGYRKVPESDMGSSRRQANFFKRNLSWYLISAVLLVPFCSETHDFFLYYFLWDWLWDSDYLHTANSFYAHSEAILFAIAYASGWLVGSRAKGTFSDFMIWCVGGILHGELMVLYRVVILPSAIYLVLPLTKTIGIFTVADFIIGVPWFLIAQFIAHTIVVGLSRKQPFADADRERLGRAGAWYVLTGIAWFTITFMVLGNVLIELIFSPAFYDKFASWITSAGGLSAIATATLGKGSVASVEGKELTWQTTVWSFTRKAILAISVPVFIAAALFCSQKGLIIFCFPMRLFRCRRLGLRVSGRRSLLCWGLQLSLQLLSASSRPITSI